MTEDGALWTRAGMMINAEKAGDCFRSNESGDAMIAGWCRRWRWVGGAAGREEGVVRLLGGGLS